MNKTQLREHSLIETQETKEVSRITEQPVYRIIGYENTLVSTYDFSRNITLPDGIWSISKATPEGIFQLHINQQLLEDNKKSAVWAAKMLEMQIYLKKELDE